MDNPAVVRRLDLIIVLLVALLALELAPVLPTLLFYGALTLLVALLAAFVWGLWWGYR